jgi:hypothetical protein
MEPAKLDRSNYRGRIVYINGYLRKLYHTYFEFLKLITKKGVGYFRGKNKDKMVIMHLVFCMSERRLFEHSARRRYYPAGQIPTYDNTLGLDRFESAPAF